MKLPFVFLIILVSCLAFLVTVDMLSGMSFREAVNILAQSFTVVTVEEKIIVAVAVIIPFYLPLIGYFKKKRKQKQIEAGKK
ncbi:hypothetical protein KP806_25860 [Paenibacillus sp. N4]|uniref:hypothetical protein n=1 Tax=Paenibacillus vietnamensis TaxID=2590547 RepID=UPI001CD18567|nr:hypothetical protein [Paenibacillus vietnamensis]MCA0758487.1 hypothetical protein [Paenibacillus vietnamensis]